MVNSNGNFLHRLHRRINEFLAGASLSWTLVPYRMRQRAEMERLFALILSAELLGLPLVPPGYALKLLPHLMPNLLSWRRLTIFSGALEGADLRHIGH